MFVFGVHIASQEMFDRHCLPSIAAFGGRDATLITTSDLPAVKAYNDIIEAAAAMDGVEAIVLLREHTEITDPLFMVKVTKALSEEPGLDILGPAGGTDPEAPDATCLVLRPNVPAKVRFDDEQFTEATGREFDADLLRRATELGLRVGTVPISIRTHDITRLRGRGSGVTGGLSAGGTGGLTTFESAAVAWQGRAAHRITRSLLERWREQSDGDARASLPADDRAPGAPAGGPTSTNIPIAEAYALERAELINHVPTDARRVLDVSCGSGARGEAIKQATGAHVVGIESGESLAGAARTRLDEVWQLDLNETTELPESEPFDAIVVSGTLERLVDPEGVLRALTRRLAPEGVLIATVPNIKHWSIMLPLLLQDRFEYSENGSIRPSSLRFFTMIEAASLLRKAGLGWCEAAAATSIPLAEPKKLDPFFEVLAGYGVDPAEARTLFDAYEFVLTARLTRPGQDPASEHPEYGGDRGGEG